MYRVEYANLYTAQVKEPLTWSPLDCDGMGYPTEKAAYQVIANEIAEDADNEDAGVYVYRVVKVNQIIGRDK